MKTVEGDEPSVGSNPTLSVNAHVMELVDIGDLKSPGCKAVWVQVPPWVIIYNRRKMMALVFDLHQHPGGDELFLDSNFKMFRSRFRKYKYMVSRVHADGPLLHICDHSGRVIDAYTTKGEKSLIAEGRRICHYVDSYLLRRERRHRWVPPLTAAALTCFVQLLLFLWA